MARRPKEDALATRERLLDAAELLFQAQGVSRTTLQQIAQAAGATRGAVYWHFEDKADLFNAMMDRVTLPLEAANRAGLRATHADEPLLGVQQTLDAALRLISTDLRARRVIDIATRKIEYTDEMAAVVQRHLASRRTFLSDLEHALTAAARLAGRHLVLPVAMAAQGLHSLVGGLIEDWLLEPEAFDLVEAGRNLLLVYLTGLGLGPQCEGLAGAAAKQRAGKSARAGLK